jgi:RES domain-containing protein
MARDLGFTYLWMIAYEWGPPVFNGHWALLNDSPIYAASSLVLAFREPRLFPGSSGVHPRRGHRVICLRMPDIVAVQKVSSSELPTDWPENRNPIKELIAAWREANKTAVISIPVTRESAERVFILNPRNRDFHQITIAGEDEADLNKRLVNIDHAIQRDLEETRLRTFISYARRDSAIALDLHDRLEHDGFATWIDKKTFEVVKTGRPK